MAYHRRHHGHHSYHRRNPSFQSYLAVLPTVGYAIVGGVATAMLPSLVFGPKAVIGGVGYLAGAGAAIALSWAGHAILGARAGDGILIGGFLKVALDIVGDLTGKRLGGFSSLKGYGPLPYVLPSSTPGISYQLPASGAVTSAPAAGGGLGIHRGRSKFAA